MDLKGKLVGLFQKRERWLEKNCPVLTEATRNPERFCEEIRENDRALRRRRGFPEEGAICYGCGVLLDECEPNSRKQRWLVNGLCLNCPRERETRKGAKRHKEGQG